MNSKTIDDQCVNDNLSDSLPPITEENENEGNDFDRESKRPRGTTSKVWDHFTKIVIKNGKEKAKFNACGAEYVFGGTKVGTSSMLCHLSKCMVLKKLKDNNVGKMIIDHVEKLRSREIDQKVLDDLISMAIIQHELPYNLLNITRLKNYLCWYRAAEYLNYGKKPKRGGGELDFYKS